MNVENFFTVKKLKTAKNYLNHSRFNSLRLNCFSGSQHIHGNFYIRKIIQH